MDLLSMASGAISTVVPRVELKIRVSTGYTKNASHAQVPSYAPAFTVLGSIQPMEFRDLMQVDSLNLQGTRRKVFLQGKFDGISRPDVKGGDLIIEKSGVTWLVAQVLEQWPDWCMVAVTLQNERAP